MHESGELALQKRPAIQNKLQCNHHAHSGSTQAKHLRASSPHPAPHPHVQPTGAPGRRALYELGECQLQHLRLWLPHMVQPGGAGNTGWAGCFRAEGAVKGRVRRTCDACSTPPWLGCAATCETARGMRHAHERAPGSISGMLPPLSATRQGLTRHTHSWPLRTR